MVMTRKWGSDFKIGCVLAGIITFLSLVSFFWTPFDYNGIDTRARFARPSPTHFMGCDSFGRDVFSRVMTGGKYTLLVALVTVLGSATAGSILGLVSGYAGGIFDEIIMRLIDAISSFPGILLALVMITIVPGRQSALVIALLILFIPGYVRIMRSGMLQYRRADFVRRVEIAGAAPFRIIFIHVLPNVAPSLLAATVLGLSNAILAEATMSYLGLGIQPPIPSWGRMLSESQNFLFNAPWCALFPGMMTMLTVIAFHLIGEGIQRRWR
jgi:peptide/nickel transport system permease protein